MDQSPRSAALSKGRGKGQRRPRKPKSASGQLPGAPMGMTPSPLSQPQPNIPMQGVQGPSPQVPHMGPYSQPTAGMQQGQQFANTPGQQQWYNQQQQQQQAQGYYPQQMTNGEFYSIWEYKCSFLIIIQLDVFL